MPEVIIKYNSDKTLQILKGLSKYFDFVLTMPKAAKKKEPSVNGVTFSPADSTIDVSDLSEIFTGKNIEAKSLRTEAWRRK